MLRLSQVIDRPPAEVFAAIVDVATFPVWNPTTKSAKKVSEGPTGEGTRFDLQIKGFGVVPQELREFERDKRVMIVPDAKPFTGGHRFMLTPEGNGTRIDHELEMHPRGIFKLMSPMIGLVGRKNLRDTAAALKSFLESR